MSKSHNVLFGYKAILRGAKGELLSGDLHIVSFNDNASKIIGEIVEQTGHRLVNLRPGFTIDEAVAVVESSNTPVKEIKLQKVSLLVV